MQVCTVCMYGWKLWYAHDWIMVMNMHNVHIHMYASKGTCTYTHQLVKRYNRLQWRETMKDSPRVTMKTTFFWEGLIAVDW